MYNLLQLWPLIAIYNWLKRPYFKISTNQLHELVISSHGNNGLCYSVHPTGDVQKRHCMSHEKMEAPTEKHHLEGTPNSQLNWCK